MITLAGISQFTFLSISNRTKNKVFKQPNVRGIKIIRISNSENIIKWFYASIYTYLSRVDFSQNLIKTIIEVINFTTFRQSFEFWN